MAGQRVIPYLAVHDGPAAIAFYVDALGAQETMRVVMDDGRVGHAELDVGGVSFYLADEFPEIGVVSPRTVGATTSSIHLAVDDVDAVFSAAVAAGATAQSPPADQPDGARRGTLVDPFGHRWMLSQEIEPVSEDEYARRMAAAGARVDTSARVHGAIWAALNLRDAPAGIRFVCDVFGFDEQLVVPGDEPGVVIHSQLRWPEGGVVQAATAHRPGNVFSERPVGGQSLYVITADPGVVYERCLAAGMEIISPLAEPDHDPGGLAFSVRDPEGNLWSFGTYDGEDRESGTDSAKA
jgi:PhnB protein